MVWGLIWFMYIDFMIVYFVISFGGFDIVVVIVVGSNVDMVFIMVM